MAFRKLVKCPSCRFANRFGDAHCIICKADLPQKEADREAPDIVARHRAEAVEVKQTQRWKKPREPKPPGRLSSQQAKRERLRAQPITRVKVPRPGEHAAKRTIAWLRCDPLPPIPLGLRPALVIGRDAKCDLCLPHKEVSRQHGVLKVRGKALAYEDEGSSNGTYLNGKRISTVNLKVGDVLTLGPYELEIVSNETMAARNDPDGSTNKMDLTAVARMNPEAAMAGRLEEIPIAEIFQGIEFNTKTGTLSVAAGTRRGKLVVKRGKPIYATFGKHKDDEAVLQMISLKEGRFSLSGEVEDGDATMQSTLTGLLLEASRRIDEGEETGSGPEDADAQGFSVLEEGA